MSTPVVLPADLAVPPRVEEYGRTALIVGGVGLALTVVGAFFDAGQFFRSYLFGFLFWNGVAVGCLSIALIHQLTGGMWGLVSRRVLEAGARTLPLCALLFVPVALGLPQLYEWADHARVQADPILQQKAPYLNVPFFLARAAFYFAVWCGLAWLLDRSSVELDEAVADPKRAQRIMQRMSGLGGGGLLLLGLTITFSSVDWAMSLAPHWFSTVYGVLFMVGQALSALALVIVVMALLGNDKPLVRVLEPTQVHDLGKLLLAFVMLWAYINVSQWIIIWSANLPEETPWYIARLHGGWQYLALLLVIFHFLLPFLLLLSRDLKRDARRLAALAAAVLLMRVVDLYWLIAPDAPLGHAHGGLHLHWMDLTAVAGLGGVWVWFFTRLLARRALLPVGEPDIRERLAEGRA
jgi:hypothetical protein